MSQACSAIATSALLAVVDAISSALKLIVSLIPKFWAIALFRSRDEVRTSIPVTCTGIPIVRKY
ncbi:unannotated protein [freshwater metagenome]|uniref:Unannotated protein n=1 Tax=freshwater metagenome TaxID=449393 RepID=A0A6J6NJZ7_9ZZZZ